MAVTISRFKVARSRLATGYGAAWNWRYDVHDGSGKPVVQGAERLSIARRRANETAKATGDTVVQSW
jgi:hypothetical protein